MIGDHHGRAAGTATLLLTTLDGILGTHMGNGRGVLVPPDDPHALAAALSRVLGGQRPDSGPGRAYARQFTPSAAAAVYLGAYRRLLASFGHPETAAIPAASSPAATDTTTE
jgi:glycosyltransferase involved in cell wall biosynthesis